MSVFKVSFEHVAEADDDADSEAEADVDDDAELLAGAHAASTTALRAAVRNIGVRRRMARTLSKTFTMAGK